MANHSNSDAQHPLSRRRLLTGSVFTLGALAVLPRAGRAAGGNRSVGDLDSRGAVADTAANLNEDRIVYCLNTSTIRGQELSLEQEVGVAIEAGYGAIEPWMNKIHVHRDSSGSLVELRKRLEDAGLAVASAIGFARWIVDDDDERERGFEQARRDMEALAELGATRMAAPPSGATQEAGLDLVRAAERYHRLIELGEEFNIVPMAEVWGFSANINRLGDAVYLALESGHPAACVLPDVYHLYKGGSPDVGLSLLRPEARPVLHMNDIPDGITRDVITDGDRIWPGDGVGRVPELLARLAGTGPLPVLSLELFNEDYWKLDPLVAAKTGLEKMRSCVAAARGLVGG
jgi:sugar phosphate isomerase/epimerase